MFTIKEIKQNKVYYAILFGLITLLIPLCMLGHRIDKQNAKDLQCNDVEIIIIYKRAK